MLIAAPILDESGQAVYNLCTGDLPKKMSSVAIETLADCLLRACVQIMDHRAT